MAKLPIGEKVFIIATGEIGFVLDYYPDFTVAVSVEGELVKVHQSGIAAAREFGKPEKSIKSEVPDTHSLPPVKGLGMMMKPVFSTSGETVRFEIRLVNNTDVKHDLHYMYTLQGVLKQDMKKEIMPYSEMMLHEFKTDQLNDSPVFRFEFNKNSSAASSGEHFEKEFKIKPKQFFSKLDEPEFQKNKFIFFSIQEFTPQVVKEKENKELPVTDEWEKERGAGKGHHHKKIQQHDIVQKAEMPDFIDLHIGKLEKHYQLLSSADILQIQLRNCRYFIDKAIRYRLDKIYLVHGLGKGILKDEIHKLLNGYPDIVSFNNNYHPRFGFGATEVILL